MMKVYAKCQKFILIVKLDEVWVSFVHFELVGRSKRQSIIPPRCSVSRTC
jgi:hypothetical protein